MSKSNNLQGEYYGKLMAFARSYDELLDVESGGDTTLFRIAAMLAELSERIEQLEDKQDEN